MTNRHSRFALRIVAFYAAGAVLWIVASEELVAWIAQDVPEAIRLNVFKGGLFVLATSLLLFGLLRHHARETLRYAERSREAAARYRTLFEQGNDAMLVVRLRDGQVLEANRAAAALYGVARGELPRRCWTDLQTEPPPEAVGGPVRDKDVWHRKAGGQRFPVEVSVNPLVWSGEDVELMIVRDVSAAMARHATLDRLAHQDVLTGLPNRHMLADYTRVAIAHANRAGTLLAVCFVDLDGFKAVNDQFGHDAGDQLLKQVARRMQEQVRAGDVVLRLGGDEFIILLGDINTLGECDSVLRRVLIELARPVALAHGEAQVTASVGVAIYPNDGDGADALVASADGAMYRAKQAGKNRIAFFNAAHERRLKAREELLDRVARAMAERQLTLWYQPVVNTASGRVESVEALMRWQHPVLGMLPASEFLPFVSGDGIKQALDLWVLERVAADWASWDVAGIDCGVRVNLFACSSRQSQLVDALARLVEAAPEREVTVELDARTVAGDHRSFDALAAACRALGVRLSLDGMIAGSDSVYALVTSALHEIKIAPGLLGIAVDGSGDDRVVNAYISFGAGAGRKVVAKEVHGAAQLRRVRDLGCPAVQGHALSPPVASAAVPDLLGRVFDGAHDGSLNGSVLNAKQ